MTGPAYGQANGSTDASAFNVMQFLISAALSKMQTISIASVIAVHGGGVAPTGTVDVQILVNLITGNGTSVPHGVIYGVPFARAQGGTNAVICDPAIGDTGLVAFASRDISSVKTARAQANPASARQFDWADAIYVSGMLNGAPTQYIMFNMSGIEIVSPTALSITAPTVTVNGNLVVTGTTMGTGEGIFNGTPVSTHVHPGVTTGSGSTGAPVP